MATTTDIEMPDTRSAQQKCLVIGLVGTIACVALGLSGNTRALQGYLLAYAFWAAISLGSLSILLLRNVTGGRWGIALRRILEAAIRTLPLMALLLVPVFIGAGKLYPWAAPEAIHDELIQKKAAYLNVPGFIIRNIVYFGFWLVVGHFLYSWSGKQDHENDASIQEKMSALSAPSLVIYALVVTFASFDWLMSLEPHWFSTIYGVKYASGAALAALAFCVIVVSRYADRDPYPRILEQGIANDLGNLMLAFTMFWTYISFSEFLIIWCANLPEETPYYLKRFEGGWEWIGVSLLVLHFLVPFVLLLSRNIKKRSDRLAKVACWLLVMRVVDLLWLVVPAFSPRALRLPLFEMLALVGVGGLWLWLFLRSFSARPLLPKYDAYVMRVTEEAEDATHA